MDENIAAYIEEVRRIPDISPAEEAALVGRIQRGDQRAEYRLAEAHMKHVVGLAQQYLNDNPAIKSPTLSDLIQAGNTGLLLAVRKYLPGADYDFWAYAQWWVRREIEILVQYS